MKLKNFILSKRSQNHILISSEILEHEVNLQLVAWDQWWQGLISKRQEETFCFCEKLFCFTLCGVYMTYIFVTILYMNYTSIRLHFFKKRKRWQDRLDDSCRKEIRNSQAFIETIQVKGCPLRRKLLSCQSGEIFSAIPSPSQHPQFSLGSSLQRNSPALPNLHHCPPRCNRLAANNSMFHGTGGVGLLPIDLEIIRILPQFSFFPSVILPIPKSRTAPKFCKSKIVNLFSRFLLLDVHPLI